jgi:hypothetical protein
MGVLIMLVPNGSVSVLELDMVGLHTPKIVSCRWGEKTERTVRDFVSREAPYFTNNWQISVLPAWAAACSGVSLAYKGKSANICHH